MNYYIRKYIFLTLFSTLLILTSCAEKEDIDPSSDYEDGVMSIDLSCITRGEEGSELETVEHFRMVLIDNAGKVKANDFIEIQNLPDYQDNEKELDKFQYTWNFSAPFGSYHLYIIANEKSISDYSVSGNEEGYQGKTLSQFLDTYPAGVSGFGDILNKIIFKPDFNKPIVLSCDYKIDFNSLNSQFNAYLVNVATKFDFHFKNYRNEAVTFTNISLDKVADRNYLLANIDDDHKYVDDVYWIDWMKGVVDDTNKYPEIDDSEQSNDKINDLWGWLNDYGMPEPISYSTYEFIETDDTWTVPSSEPQTGSLPDPGTLSMGPFYFPESKYIPANKTVQSYALTFDVLQSDETTKTFHRDLGKIKTLFRNTYAVVDVEISLGVESIYVEVYPWVDKDEFYGIVSPE